MDSCHDTGRTEAKSSLELGQLFFSRRPCPSDGLGRGVGEERVGSDQIPELPTVLSDLRMVLRAGESF